MAHPHPPMLAVGHSPPRLALGLAALIALAAGCASRADAPVPERIEALLPADVLLLGEQHDAAEHQALQREAVLALTAKGQLAALALEMAESGRSTARLGTTASEAQVRTALAWNDKGWPWQAYGPVVMDAVRAGVPVLGANLPRARMKDAMSDVSLDVQLNEKALAAQQAAVRDGHCGLLPEAQIAPMTRIQIARDRAMAHTAAQAVAPGRTVLLLMGSAHADKALGVPQHLPTELRVRSVGLVAGDAQRTDSFDARWRTPALPPKDYCASLRAGEKPGA
ncbi:ChaN family lipoprotein [Xenophilus arseniciresistens]|uniref:ChaN family lipoprotein n=1 Tax=Xenophilus arseniciresistens TaxID=1283306 RepID=A0AAE3NCJ6_9BURK|nr:ChaN family lipoprotein [Xenophilus arseniciresistens]MDA7418913.1 ChaN family lipoprotein [Xenophilus arseniciresistens]